MEIVSLSSTNYFGLTASYTPDSGLALDQNIYYTEQGTELPLTEIFNNLQDTTTNNYSNLYLTKYDCLSSEAFIKPLAPIASPGFSTYLATYNSPLINSSTVFLVVQEPSITTNLANVSLSGTSTDIDNRYIFEVKFLSEVLCQIIHSNGGVERYLTVGAGGNFYFAKQVTGQAVDQYNQQVFYYIFDATHGLIVLSKNITDVVKYVSYSGTDLTLVDPTSGTGISYPNTSIFRCLPQTSSSNTTPLFDSWVGYTRNFKNNTQDIDPTRSVQSIKSNLLVNTEYSTITGSTLNVNLLSLKNTNTPENYQSRSNPFQSSRSKYLSGTAEESREYNALFTGSNQRLGHDNITLGYDSYTTDIVLPADQVTYFHVPQTLYPYVQLNIADSGLIEAGAIAGDHPMKADKIFKKLASAKYTTPYGASNDETTGDFLCSWLSGGRDINVKPVWVDRYYNPSEVSYVQALTSSQDAYYYNMLETYKLMNQADVVNGGDAPVFDKPSDLIFEPGTYYVYHHLGNNYVKQYVQTFLPQLVENYFNYYRYTNNSNVLTQPTSASEYVFDGS